jgi:hypothetical protein
MLSRLRLLVLTLTIVLVVHFAYRLLAVPWLEPSVSQRAGQRQSGGDVGHIPQSQRDEALALLFPPDAWERDEPKVLETDRGMLLLKDYQPQADGYLSLDPCTVIVYLESNQESDPSRPRRPVVLQAPQGALLRFDGGLDLTRGQIGRLRGGKLTGPIRIFSPESQPGANDRLEAHTQDVQIEPTRIVAPGPCDFRYGPSSGRGRDLTVTLSPASKTPSAASKNPQLGIGAPQLLTLAHVEKIELEVQTAKELKRGPASDSTKPKKSGERLEITCQGPFQFDFPQRLATFEDHVDVVHANVGGPSDQLNCRRLAIRLSPGDKPPMGQAAGSGPGEKPGRVEIESLQAHGSPAILRAPSYSASARGELLEYNFRTKRVRVVDSQTLQLRYEQHQFEARTLEYQFAEEGRLGQLRATGPGVLRGALPEDPKKTFEAAWRDRLILQPHQGRHAISLLSQARLRYSEMGDFAADNIHIWLREVVTPPKKKDAKASASYLPDRMLAEGNVQIAATQLSAATKKAEVWIRYENALAGAQAGAAAAGTTRRTLAPTDEQRPLQKFDVVGELLQMQLVRQGREVDVEHLIIDRHVRFRETQTAKPGEIPLSITGDIVQVDRANTPAAQVRVRGQPAEVSARGAVLVGEDLQLNRGDGRAWIAGPGSMRLPTTLGPPSADRPRGPSPAESPPTCISWQGHMEFNGLVAHFARDVHVQGVQQNQQGEQFELAIDGPALDVTLNRRVDFSKNQQAPGLAIGQLAFQGEVQLKNRGRLRGQPTSRDELHMLDLNIEQSSGRLQARGPGWGTSVRRRATAANLTSRQRTTDEKDRGAELAFVRIDFDEQLTGNITNREVQFHGRVRTIYGPVTDWDQTLDPNPVDGLGQNQLALSSDHLALAQMGPATAGDEAAVELIATGNASVEGSNFTARGNRISYARAKELLILQGDGRNDAEFWRKGSTHPDAAAQGLRFWIKDNRLEWDGGKFLNLSQLGRTLR